MGEHAQKRIIRKIDLEQFLSKIALQPTPQAHLEQYTTSESVAANVLHLAAYTNGDIINKTVLDLGCGTGRLALGALYLGAKTAVGIDVDPSAIQTAQENAKKAGFEDKVSWVLGDISTVQGAFDTVVQNPPFGVQTREADRAFLVKALQSADTVYSLHNHPEFDERLVSQLRASRGFLQVAPQPFLDRFIEKYGGIVEEVYAMLLSIPKMFDFHTKARHDFVVDLYVIHKKQT